MNEVTYFRGEYNIKGLKKIPAYVLLYADSVVVCVVEPKEIKAETKRITAALKTEKVGLLQRPKAIQERLDAYGEKFAKLDQAEALCTDSRNCQIFSADVTEAVFQRRPKDVGQGEFNTTIPGRFVLKTNQGKTVVYHDYEDQIAAEKVLADMFVGRIKIS